MSYLKFDKTRMVNLEYSLKREILRTNRRGAYHYTTIVECNTRKQHGLLVMPIPELDNTKHVLLSSFDETVIQHGAEFNLGIHKYDGDQYSPMGHKYIREFDCDACPRTVYRVGGVVLSKEKLFSLKDNSIMIRYTLLDAHSPTILRLKPFLAFREINSLTNENIGVNQSYTEVENGISTCMYDGYPDLYMQFNKEVDFVFAPNWNKGIEYKEDMEEGLAYKEDLYVPGYFELSIKKGETIVFSASDKSVSTKSLLADFENGFKERTPRTSFFNCLKNSAYQFYFRPSDQELYLLEGYPWFKVNARSQFMSLPGLTLNLDRDSSFEEIMDTAYPSIKDLMEGKKERGHIQGMSEPDVLLWITWALGRFAHKHKEKCHEKYGSLILEIISFIQSNKHENLKVLNDGLLWTEGKDKAVSWMNTTIMGKPVVPRTGYLVEFNALWYNALRYAADIAKAKGDEKTEKRLSEFSGRVRQSFNDVFVNSAGYLFDYVDGHLPNWNVRPNMIFAVSMDHSPLDRKISRSIIDIVTKELLTPKGIRSLSPKSEGYAPHYQGNQIEKDYAQFNGTAYPWMLAAYMDACMLLFQRSGMFYVERVMVELEDEMSNNCIGSFSQLYDGNPPYAGHGAASYALSIAGVARVLGTAASFENESKTI